MRPFDFAPLYRSTVGFDRLAQLLDSVAGVDNDAPSYPPYNIERLGENEYRITMAVAGFTESELELEVKEQNLTVKGVKASEVKGAALQDGFLYIDLVRNVPERLKPRSIAIGNGPAKQIEVA